MSKYYSNIGLSCMLTCILFSCSDKNEIVESISNDLYVYKNESESNVIFTISSSIANRSESYNIALGDSKIFFYSGSPGTAPFFGSGYHLTGDSAKIEFDNGKCLEFSRDNSDGVTGDEGTGVFNLNNYSVIYQSSLQKTCTYVITEADRISVPDCP